MATVEFDDVPPVDSDDFLGVDLGVANLATTHEGEHFTGENVEHMRVQCQTLRQTLQSATDKAKTLAVASASARSYTDVRSKKPTSAETPITFSPSESLRRPKTLAEVLPWKTSRASGLASGFASLNAPAWRDGLLTNCGSSSPTRRKLLACGSRGSIPSIPVRGVPSVAISSGLIAYLNLGFVVVGVGTKPMPMSTRLGISELGPCVNEPIVSACLPLRRPGEPGTSRLLQGAVVDGLCILSVS